MLFYHITTISRHNIYFYKSFIRGELIVFENIFSPPAMDLNEKKRNLFEVKRLVWLE